jgi:hypothetical protein
MSSGDSRREPGAAAPDAEAATEFAGSAVARIASARTFLDAIDRTVFPGAVEIPFDEHSVTLRRAVMRLFGHG